jgi:capsular exopolysaccharide synthesis family protein
MSQLYESLRRAEMEQRSPGEPRLESARPTDLPKGLIAEPAESEGAGSAAIDVPSASRLVAQVDPKCLAAEKFRALATRLENLRNERDLKSLQVTSSVIGEGKTFVTGNLALTLAKHSGVKVLVVEGDLHRPGLASLLGLTGLRGLSHWWSGREENLGRYIYKLNGLALWFLSAGEASEQPSQVLQSPRFAKAFARLGGSFDWILVDSTPVLPTADVNLWGRLVDGMLLVVRAGVAPVEALKKGLASVDNPKLVGIVLNEASDSRQNKYANQQYSAPKDARNGLNDKNKKK